MSYEGSRGYEGDSKRGRGRGRRPRGSRGGNTGFDFRTSERNKDDDNRYSNYKQGYNKSQVSVQNQGKREIGAHTKERVQEELLKSSEEKRTYSKIQLLEMFISVEIDQAKKIMQDDVAISILTDHAQSPILLEEPESELTLEDLRPRKGGQRRRGDFQAADKQTDDLEDDEDPEWLDFEPQEKKFDFSKQQTLTKMFEGNDDVKYEALEDDEEETNETTQPQAISIEQLEKQTFSRLEQEKQREPTFTPNNQASNSMNNPASNPINNQMNNPINNPMNNPMNNPIGNQMPFGQNMNNFGFGMQNYPHYQDPSMGQYGSQMDYGGFPRPDPFGGFGQPFDNPMGMPPMYDDHMGFGGNLFSPPPFERDAEFDKIFGHSPYQNQMNPFFSQGNPMGGPQDMGGMFGLGMGPSGFMAQNEDDDEEVDWLMDDQFEETEKHLGFINQPGDTPVKQKLYREEIEEIEQVKIKDDEIDRIYKYVRKERKRVPKPRKVHTFEPKFKEKKRFEKLFDKVNQEENLNRRPPNQQDLNMYQVKKYWDLRDEPNHLEILNLIQNPFSYHIIHRRNSPPQFFINKDGPVYISELYTWFNQGLVPKFFLIGYDENCYKFNSKPCFLYEKFFNEFANSLFDDKKLPEEIINKALENTVEELKIEEVIEPELKASQVEENQTSTQKQFDPQIPYILQDEGVTLIDASQLESSLIAASQRASQNNVPGNYGQGIILSQPIDPAIVSFQPANISFPERK